MRTRTAPPARLILLGCLAFLTSGFAEPKPPAAANPLTDAECETFGRKIETEWRAGNKESFFRWVDFDTLFDRVVAGLDIPEKTRANLRDDFLNGFKSGLAKEYAQARDFKFIRLRNANGEARLLFRLTTKGGGLNYQELILKRGGPGQPRIADFHMHLLGEKLSDSLRRLLIPMIAEEQRSLLEKLFSDSPDIIKHQKEWSEVAQLGRQGKSKECLEAYAKLPLSLQREKFLLAIRLKAAAAASDREHLAALDFWRRTYPRDPAVDLISMDAFLLRKQYAQALECVDRFSQVIGKEAGMDFQRAVICRLLGEKAKAIASLKSALALEPDMFSAYDVLVRWYTADGQFADAVHTLQEFRTVSQISHSALLQTIEEDKYLTELVASPEYRRWRGSNSTGIPGAKPTGNSAGSPLKLQGITYAARSSAVISGKTVLTGDNISGYRVVQIDRAAVTLEAKDGKQVILKME